MSFNPNKEECSYHFTHPHDAPALHWDCDTRKHTARFEHITWHKNIAQIKREDNAAIERVTFLQGPLFSATPEITPIYVESLYFQDNKPCLREVSQFKPWKGSLSQQVLSLNSSLGFSILFLLVPSGIDTRSVLVGTQFLEMPEGLDRPPCLGDLCDVDHRPGRIRLWKDWDFLVVPSQFKCRILSPLPPILGDSFRLPNYQNVQAVGPPIVATKNCA